MNRGYVDNTATAAYRYAGQNYSEQDQVRVNALQENELTIDKEAKETGFAAVGDVMTLYISL